MHVPDIVNSFDILDEYWPIDSCPDCYIERDSTAESGFFVMFFVIKVRTHIGVLASGLLTISGLVSTISVSSNFHLKDSFLPMVQNSKWTNR